METDYGPVNGSNGGLVLLPIREAYEWKRRGREDGGIVHLFLLPIREAYEWKR